MSGKAPGSTLENGTWPRWAQDRILPGYSAALINTPLKRGVNKNARGAYLWLDILLSRNWWKNGHPKNPVMCPATFTMLTRSAIALRFSHDPNTDGAFDIYARHRLCKPRIGVGARYEDKHSFASTTKLPGQRETL